MQAALEQFIQCAVVVVVEQVDRRHAAEPVHERYGGVGAGSPAGHQIGLTLKGTHRAGDRVRIGGAEHGAADPVGEESQGNVAVVGLQR